MYLNASAMAVPFYISHGFEIAGKALLGVDNPTWSGPPIVCTVVSPVLVDGPSLTDPSLGVDG